MTLKIVFNVSKNKNKPFSFTKLTKRKCILDSFKRPKDNVVHSLFPYNYRSSLFIIKNIDEVKRLVYKQDNFLYV